LNLGLKDEPSLFIDTRPQVWSESSIDAGDKRPKGIQLAHGGDRAARPQKFILSVESPNRAPASIT
jgi:hypothetical protein